MHNFTIYKKEERHKTDKPAQLLNYHTYFSSIIKSNKERMHINALRYAIMGMREHLPFSIKLKDLCFGRMLM